MSSIDALNPVFDKPGYRLIIAALLVLATLFVIISFAVKTSPHDSANYQKVSFDGYIYFPEQGYTIENFLAAKEISQTTTVARKDFTTTMRGEHWLWFSPHKISTNLEILQIELAWLDRVEIFFLAKDGGYETYQAGDEHRFNQRVIAFRKPAFPLLREINQSEVATVALRISAQGRFSLPLFVLSEQEYNRQANLDYLFYGAWLAVLIALGFYNATIFFSLRYNVHFYYIIYVFVFSALLITASGIGQQYLWPNSGNLTTLLANVFLALTNYGTAFFVIHFIRLSDYSTMCTALLKGFAYISLLCIPGVFFFGYDALTPILVCSFAIMALILTAAVYAGLKGNQVAPFLFASLVVLLPCNTIGLIRFMGFLENALWAEHLAELGLVADALILSLALAYQVNYLRREKEQVNIAREKERIAFAKRLIHAQEEERKVIGKALHDDLGHKVLAIKNSVAAIPQGDDTRFKTGSLEMLNEALEKVRDLSHLLYPSIIDHLGFDKAISSVVSKSLYAKDITYTLDVPVLNVSDELELLIYRAVQEFVSNVIKHSNASLFKLNIMVEKSTNEIFVMATDNGDMPFTSNDFGFGLNMLKQQAALFDGDLTVQRTHDDLNQITLSIVGKR